MTAGWERQCPRCRERHQTEAGELRCAYIHAVAFEVQRHAAELDQSPSPQAVFDLVAHLGLTWEPEKVASAARAVLDLGWRPQVTS